MFKTDNTALILGNKMPNCNASVRRNPRTRSVQMVKVDPDVEQPISSNTRSIRHRQIRNRCLLDRIGSHCPLVRTANRYHNRRTDSPCRRPPQGSRHPPRRTTNRCLVAPGACHHHNRRTRRRCPAPLDQIVAESAADAIVVILTVQLIVAETAVHGIVAVSPVERVVIKSAVHGVIPCCPNIVSRPESPYMRSLLSPPTR